MNVADENTKYYDHIADSYDTETSQSKWLANDILTEELPPVIDNIDRYLDLGSGTGLTIEAVKGVCEPEHITAVDSSEKMLEVLHKRLSNVKTMKSSIKTFIDSDSSKYDLITAIGALEFVPELPNVLSTLGNHLNDNGTLAFTYEPIIRNLKEQSERKSVYDTNVGNETVRFTAFRWSPDDVRNALDRGNLEIMKEILLTGYERENGMPVIYSLIICKTA